jgi:hypothetical protein
LNASSRDSRFIDIRLRLILEIEIGKVLAVRVHNAERFLTFFDRPWRREPAGH